MGPGEQYSALFSPLGEHAIVTLHSIVSVVVLRGGKHSGKHLPGTAGARICYHAASAVAGLAMSDTPPPSVAGRAARGLRHRPRYRLLRSLEYSQREAGASSARTATTDNFTNAFALHLGASNLQMGLLTGVPQLLG